MLIICPSCLFKPTFVLYQYHQIVKTTALLFLFLSATVSLPAQTKCDFAGKWATNLDGAECQLNMIMTYANTMTGSYYYEVSSGTINGTIYGTVKDEASEGSASKISMSGQWSEGEARGTFLFVRDCSSGIFAGTWKNYNGQQHGVWVGEKQ